ncbi:MAG TPA: glutaredoxin domain-containing protein [Roseiflexaceae bacterium]|nr:glutaredoxin domain-containing protein [Roseiflexaceae bacterium]
MTLPNVTVYGTNWCGDCKRAVRVLKEQQWPYTYIDIEQDDEARAYVQQVNNGMQSVPTIIFPDGSVLVEPSSSALTAKLNTFR